MRLFIFILIMSILSISGLVYVNYNSVESIDLISRIILKLTNAMIFFILLSIFLRLFDGIMGRSFDPSFLKNNISAGVYFAVRFFSLSIGLALCVM